MKLDFDTNTIRKNKIELLDCQVDLILRSLELYSYTYEYIYPRRGKSESLEENLRICLVRDTYHQITSELQDLKFSKNEYKLYKHLENLEKIA